MNVPNIHAKKQNTKAYLKTYCGETLVDTELVNLPGDYDGDPYGDTVPFSVGSNQELVVIDEEGRVTE